MTYQNLDTRKSLFINPSIRTLSRVFVVLVFVFSSVQCASEPSSNLSHGEEKIDWSAYDPSIAVIGDSISTGLFANTTLGKFPSHVFGKTVEKSIKHLDTLIFKGGKNKYTEAIIKDAGDQRHLTAYGTRNDWGLRHHLLQLYPSLDSIEQVQVFNVSHISHETRNIPWQVDKLLDIYSNQAQQAGHVYVLLGANDFCHGKTVSQFKQSYRRGLEYMLRSHARRAHVVVGYLPPIDKLASDGNGELGIILKGVTIPKFRKVRKKKFGIKYDFIESYSERKNIPLLKCKEFRKKYCSRMYEPAAIEIVAQFNAAIEQVVAELQPRYPIHRLTVAEGIADMGVSAEKFAWDCFHPSATGQREIALAFKGAYHTKSRLLDR